MTRSTYLSIASMATDTAVYGEANPDPVQGGLCMCLYITVSGLQTDYMEWCRACTSD